MDRKSISNQLRTRSNCCDNTLDLLPHPLWLSLPSSLTLIGVYLLDFPREPGLSGVNLGEEVFLYTLGEREEESDIEDDIEQVDKSNIFGYAASLEVILYLNYWLTHERHVRLMSDL